MNGGMQDVEKRKKGMVRNGESVRKLEERKLSKEIEEQ
jgi:hypothetical protein